MDRLGTDQQRGAMTDWIAWHERYRDPDSSLARRLGVVQHRIAETLVTLAPLTDRRVLSLCSGDGRDLINVLDGLATGQEPRSRLVELDPLLAERARRETTSRGLERLEVVTADAGDPAVWSDLLPVDLLLLCGIFGNVADTDLRATIAAVPSMLRPGGFVIWTRGDRPPDRRTAIRGWCIDAQLAEVAFDGAPEPYGVGVAQASLRPSLAAVPLPARLFTFVR